MQTVGFNENPFIWNETATFITTPVIKVSVKDEADVDVDLFAVGNEPTISIGLLASFPASEPTWTEPAPNDTMTRHLVNLTQDGSTLMVTIDTRNESLVYKVFSDMRIVHRLKCSTWWEHCDTVIMVLLSSL